MRVIRRLRAFRGMLLLTVFSLLMIVPGAGADQAPAGEFETFYFDWWDPDTGELTGGVALVPRPPAPVADPNLPRLSSTTLVDNGPSANRIDVVFLGDGYTSAELATYRSQVTEYAGHLFAVKPFNTYKAAFNVHRVDVTSAQSGIDHDPTFGVYRDTALDGEFWCNNIERLICVDNVKAFSAAASAPDADLIVVLVNSAKYGGSGGITTVVSAGTGNPTERRALLVHEMGHTFADLADEYESPGGTYTDPEPWEPNVSIYNHSQLQSRQAKWYRWLGYDQAAFGGLVSAYEGAKYNNLGVYRPTQTSIMRDLGDPFFNPPSIEALIAGIWGRVDLVDATPRKVNARATVTLPLVINRGNIEVSWFLDGTRLTGEDQPALDLSNHLIGPGRHALTAVVKDKTSWVRDPLVRDTTLTQRVRFTVRAPSYSCNGRAATHWGSDASETLLGTAGNDVFVAFEGDDTIRGFGGNDVVCAGPGNDLLLGGPGSDRLFGEGGYDQLVGGSGNDRLDGGGKGDQLSGGPGNDAFIGGTGNDSVTFRQAAGAVQARLIQQQVTGQGTDTIVEVEVLIGSMFGDLLVGDGSENRIVGNDGNDEIRGAGGNDNLRGGAGDDTIKGGDGHDFLRGQEGNDTLDGGGGTDVLAGGSGADTCTNGEVYTGC